MVFVYMGKTTQEFIAKNKVAIVTAKRLGMGAVVGIQQVALEELDARNPNRQSDDFLALQNIVPLLETGVLIPLSIMTKNAAIRSVSSSLLVGTTTMAAYRTAKMAMPFVQNAMRKVNAKSFSRGISNMRTHQRTADISPMSLGLFTSQ